ncbi:hypothetical protein SLEP1_g3110 [Rubroshorea leprosula]|uniref:Retrotransposon gag domain-containing protein n=1 Tax=Rubroshorea leprosula TaxID=152421 RepID=A0AAV5HJD1_9ROSI|nr:hypothetical protein SLEP1_g3110 [Rubroshorea leprosula]
MPQFEMYDGTKDLDDQLYAFYSVMQAQNALDTLMCKIFSSTLRGNARTWYYSLQSNSISSYAKLAASFATKFSSRRLIRKTISELMRVVQREGESLKNYMNRFNDAVLEIDSFNQVVGLAAIIQGLKHERFRDNLIKHPPTTFDEANERSFPSVCEILHTHGSGDLERQPRGGQTLLYDFELLDNRPKDQVRVTSMKEIEEVQIDDNNPTKKTQIGTKLDLKEREELIYFLKSNKDVFAWTSTNIPGIPTSDCHPLPSIDKLVEVASGSKKFSLLDAYSRYHQVHMAPKDEVKTFFYAGDKGQSREDKGNKGDETIEVNQRRAMRSWESSGSTQTYLSSPPLLTKVKGGEILYLYLGISNTTVNLVLVREMGKQQRPVYYASKMLQGAELRYSIIENAALVTLQKPECSGRLIKWAVELREFQITFQQKSSIRAQALANFVVECASSRESINSEVNFTCEVTNLTLSKYLAMVSELKCRFERFRFTKVPRTKNENADSLSKLASNSSSGMRSSYVEVLSEPSFHRLKLIEVSVDPETPSWIDPIKAYLRDGTIPNDKLKEMKLWRKASWPSMPFMSCMKMYARVILELELWPTRYSDKDTTGPISRLSIGTGYQIKSSLTTGLSSIAPLSRTFALAMGLSWYSPQFIIPRQTE